MFPYISAITNLIGILLFLGIVWWAYSAKRKKANEASAELPFDLPDEYRKD
ncbi:CcoQ/FixQ family Cbb3-type cytochrome c oxidase assembly chaperone [Polynucleobacter sp. IMCC30063]|nr:CcoQ/FixQ family Cbb3-type cytochrome c oxidase assembly chaperone [Polynucleobacter sp. IMCC30063]MCE7527568.1 CcoQ/FixQ family Cbb3-type cytochrome c oxidase assembly chaperone [Polynucleobacter sp. IMCC 30228]MCE7529386.1 CcoQ/FixQ family Cbb3-type cytochrome c oxidase assembly chaperone [Polynucleobacter sp. IMCC 29146]